MTGHLRDALRDAAAAVPNYADAERALRGARRIRRRRALVAVAAAVALATGAGGVVAVLRPEPRPPVTDAGPAYPQTVAPPRRSVALPAGRVGRAAFVYAPCTRRCDAFVVLNSGRQYRLPPPPLGGPTSGYSLSPDGRWLAWRIGSGVRVRDLDGRGVRDLDETGPGVTSAWAWSADSRWVLLVRHVDGFVQHATVLDVTTGARHRTDAVGYPVGVRTDGRLLAWEGGDAGTATLSTVDPVTGGSTRIDLDLRPSLRTGEIVTGEGLVPLPDGALATVTVQAATPDDPLGPPSAVLLLELSTGRILRRIAVPASGTDGTSYWNPHSLGPNGLTLVHSTPDRTEIVQLDLDNGPPVVRTTLPRDSSVVLRASRR